MRHSFATHLLEAGTGLLDLQDILGHTNLRTTAIYCHLTPKTQQRTHEHLQQLMNQFSINWGTF